jgi:DNA-binding response OmpR family regulator
LEVTLTTVLIVDDEPLITDSLSYSLRLEGFEVEARETGEGAVQAVRDLQPDLMVLDLMLPDIDGFEVCRQVRSFSTIPIIMLTARSDEMDRVTGLETGADDYLVKPFSFRELLARIRSTLRRVDFDRQSQNGENQTVAIHELTLDYTARKVIKSGEEIHLSTREFELLSMLMENAGRALSRSELLQQIWGPEYSGDHRTLDVHIRWLRLKIEDDPANPQYIQTLRGYGYRCPSTEEFE